MHRSHHTRKEVHEVLCPRHLGILKIAPLITHEFSPLAQAKNLAGETHEAFLSRSRNR